MDAGGCVEFVSGNKKPQGRERKDPEKGMIMKGKKLKEEDEEIKPGQIRT